MKSLACLCALLLAGALQHAGAADWNMDPAGSRLEFTATFEKAAAPGVFREFDTRMRFDPEKPADSRLDVAIKVTSADMSSADVNHAIRAPEWFDFARFPRAEFHATDIRRTEANRYVARGTLALKGVQQPLEVPFTWAGSADAATMEGEFTLKRGIFGIGAEVKVKFRVRLRKAG